jgi:hypothetical protein
VLIERGKIVKIGGPLDDWRAELIRSLLLSPKPERQARPAAPRAADRPVLVDLRATAC